MITIKPLVSRVLLRKENLYCLFTRSSVVRQLSNTSNNNNNTLVYNLNDYRSSFPNDTTVNQDISEYIDLNRDKITPNVLKIGIIYENPQVEKESKIIECLLADPLASGNSKWFNEIAKRDSKGNFHYKKEVVIDHNNHQFGIPSPILAGSYRNKFNQADDQPNDLVIEEVSDLADVTGYTYLVNVSNQLSTLDHYPRTTQSKILLNIIDNTEFTPKSFESTPVTFENSSKSHLIKINSQLAFTGIASFLEKDVAASDVFIDNMTNSNIYELYKALSWFSQTPVLSTWLLDNIKVNIARKINATASPQETNEISNLDISRYIDLVNTELQDDFEPKAINFFHKNLSWWKLYYKNDNVEYDIKDFFMNNFMNKSLENYNYLKGKISSTDANVVENPLFNLKTDLINKRIAEQIQPVVYQALGQGFVYYQLPISVISFLAYQYFGFSPNECITLASLGLVLGFNQVSKVWTHFTDGWLKNLFEEIRICLSKECVEDGLMKESNVQLEKSLKSTSLRQKILDELN
ncbi:hypothetical protein SBY92_001907 [Candida maltosa Xu316]|uniref:Mmc1 C-terminal domain-containing protein n=1 Tax=Candida maltosa (strain Xu316) TaxID=1245528 RepID=M3IWQ9_CANMX|nr:hypothetical protein G210_5973 [Candida maltosa Xu316]